MLGGVSMRRLVTGEGFGVGRWFVSGLEAISEKYYKKEREKHDINFNNINSVIVIMFDRN